jgi:hypothetical protein
MSRALLARIPRLEAARSSTGRRLVPIFATGETRAEVDAQNEALKREKGITEQDTLVVFTTLYKTSPETMGYESLYEVRKPP